MRFQHADILRVAAELPVETVGTEQPQVICAAIGQTPAVVQARAGAHGIAPWRLRQRVAVVDMQDGARAARVAQGQAIVLAVGGHASHGLQRIRQGTGVAIAVRVVRTPVAREVEG
ncbi:hypothetical protein D3C71_1503050 [compost metagenome]